MSSSLSSSSSSSSSNFLPPHARRFLEKHPDRDEHLPLYHGLKTKDIDKLYNKGHCTFGTGRVAKAELNSALKTLGKSKEISKHSNMILNSIRREVEREGRNSIWVTTDKDIACSYAKRSPEFLGLAHVPL